MAATKHNHADQDAAPHYRVPPEPNRWPAIGLAVGMHALLLAFLAIGVSWQNTTPVAVEAEIWDVTTQTAAPPPPPPEPEPEPQPEPAPPEPAPRAVAPPPPPVEQPAPPKQPDIALEREKKRQEELKRKEEARLERERELAEQKRIEEQQKREQEKKAKALAEKKEREEAEKKEKALAEKKAREEAEKKEAEQKKKEEAERKKKAEAEKKKQEAAEQKKRDAARAEEMRRLTAAAAGSGSPTSTGSAAQSTAPGRDKGYVAAITAKVKGNTAYAGSLDEPGNPTASFRVEQLPTGEIISVRKIKSSGIAAFDDAVEKGIAKSSPLPKKKDGTVERSLVIEFHMKDLQ